MPVALLAYEERRENSLMAGHARISGINDVGDSAIAQGVDTEVVELPAQPHLGHAGVVRKGHEREVVPEGSFPQLPGSSTHGREDATLEVVLDKTRREVRVLREHAEHGQGMVHTPL